MAVIKMIVTQKVPLNKLRGASPEFIHLVNGLLQRDPTQRLGADKGVYDIMCHPFFAKVDWEKAKRKDVRVPYKPASTSRNDTLNFDQAFLKQTPIDSYVNSSLAKS